MDTIEVLSVFKLNVSYCTVQEKHTCIFTTKGKNKRLEFLHFDFYVTKSIKDYHD